MSWQGRAVPAFAVALALWGAASPAWAWTPISGDFPVWCKAVPYAMNAAGSPDLGAATSETETRRAFTDWSEVECAALTVQWSGTTNASPGTYEGSSVVGWIESGWPHDRNAIGVTGPVWAFDNARQDYCILEADMLLNGVHFAWTTSPGQGSSVNAYSILLHEAGHYLGLGHSQSPSATMYFAYDGGTDSLKSDDQTGICSLYPSGSSPQDCSALGCPAGQQCVAGTCTTVIGDGSVCAICAKDADCDDGGYCLQYPDGARYCGNGCASEADCPAEDEYCVDVGGTVDQCVRFDSLSRPDCASAGGGDAECDVDTDCGENEVCDVDARACAARTVGGADVGGACDQASDCGTRLCLTSAEGGVCTLTCDWLEPASCPAGYYCNASVTGACGTGLCLAGSAGTKASGEACEADTECASLYCMGGVCSTACIPNSASGCGEGEVCQPSAITGCGACEDQRGVGAPCDSVDDCPTRLCAEKNGESFCTAECSDAEPCPSGFDCEAASASVRVCVPGAPGGLGGGGGRDGGGCAVSAYGRWREGAALQAIAVLLGLVFLRRRAHKRWPAPGAR